MRTCLASDGNDFSKGACFMRSIVHSALVACAILMLVCPALAQREMYPQKEGIPQQFHSAEMPKWMTLDMELRGRTEDQTSLGFVPGKERLYELTRVWG